MSLLEQQHKVMGNGMIERVVGVLQVFSCCRVGFFISGSSKVHQGDFSTGDSGRRSVHL